MSREKKRLVSRKRTEKGKKGSPDFLNQKKINEGSQERRRKGDETTPLCDVWSRSPESKANGKDVERPWSEENGRNG